MTQIDGQPWSSLEGQVVLLDLSSPFVVIGTLRRQQGGFVVLDDVDVHDLRDTATSREQYVQDCRRLGHTRNRRQAWVRLDEIVSFSRLEDVVAD